ncbi:S26 family signal peptidase [Candidatus Saccharibacteria bacterium]|nr:S26 family signal peptidase [Candidatus Saccharibacteria bacterium]
MSMAPSYQPGQILIGWRWGRARAGRVAVIRHGQPIIKRLIHRIHNDWWVEGDNKAVSTDSRQFGPIAASEIEAVIIWPKPQS